MLFFKWGEVVALGIYLCLLGGGATGFYFWFASCPLESIALKCWREGNYTDGDACYIDKQQGYGKQVWCTMRVETGATFAVCRGTCVRDDDDAQKELAAQELCGRMHVCYWNPNYSVFQTGPSDKRKDCMWNVGCFLFFYIFCMILCGFFYFAIVCPKWYERWHDAT